MLAAGLCIVTAVVGVALPGGETPTKGEAELAVIGPVASDEVRSWG
jgi:hypothetical protein